MFLDKFFDEGIKGTIAIATGAPQNLTYYNTPPENLEGEDIFFGPAIRKKGGGALKEDVIGTKVLWADHDDEEVPKCVIPPSMMVFSGHGWHCYWFLDQFLSDADQIEELNKLLAADLGADSCWNVNRVLRVPGTMNTKPPRRPVELRECKGFIYSPDDFKVLEYVDPKIKNRILTGDQRGFRSRSERDWSVIAALVSYGASDKLVEALFQYHPIGDKVRDVETHANYFLRSLEKAREQAGSAAPKKRKQTQRQDTLEERDDGYYAGDRRVSTFIIEPKVLLNGSVFDAEDAIVADVHAAGYTWEGVTFSRAAFTSTAKMDKECPVAAWQWLGHESDLRKLLPFLLDKLREMGLPKVAATPVSGVFTLKGKPYFVSDHETISAEGYWKGYDAPLAWLPSQKEHPTVNLEHEVTADDLKYLHQLPTINAPEAIWPMIGWYAGTIFKTWLKEQNVRFPVLNVTGTRGAGKTTIIQRILMPLFGQKDPKSYDAGTTKFVTLALMGSTNCVPIAFSEFRYESVANFIRYILLSYDTGHDPRGRADQTTVDYPLSAPYSIDGEDLIADPAAQERIVVAQLNPRTVEEGSTAYNAFQEFVERDIPTGFGGYYIRKALQAIQDGSALKTLKEAKSAVIRAFPKKMPDRVRNNHVVAYFGILMFCRAVGMAEPQPDVLAKSIGAVCNVDTGRSRSLVDEFVEAVANAVNQGNTQYFKWSWDSKNHILYFQMTPTHNWWITTRRMSGRGGLERDAIRAQLKEALYSVDPKNIDGMFMHGVDLKKAQEVGLDVSTQLSTITVRI